MRNRILILLAALSLIIAAPLLAQTEEPQTDEPQVQGETQAELTADTEDGASATAEASLITEEQHEMQGETNESDVQAEASASVSTDEERELPQTAGFLPLLALLGLGSIASALGLRAVRRK